MKKICPLILLSLYMLAACQSSPEMIPNNPAGAKQAEKAAPGLRKPMVFKTAYKSVQEIVSDTAYSNWVKF